jgi:hypothetical protein
VSGARALDCGLSRRQDRPARGGRFPARVRSGDHLGSLRRVTDCGEGAGLTALRPPPAPGAHSVEARAREAAPAAGLAPALPLTRQVLVTPGRSRSPFMIPSRSACGAGYA